MLKRERRISRDTLKSLEKPIFYVNNGLFSVRLFDNKSGNPASRFSFSVSKKIEKKAVNRNRLRRLGYNVIRDNIEKIKDGFLVRFTYNNAPKKQDPKEEVCKNVLEALSKAKLIK